MIETVKPKQQEIRQDYQNLIYHCYILFRAGKITQEEYETIQKAMGLIKSELDRTVDDLPKTDGIEN